MIYDYAFRKGKKILRYPIQSMHSGRKKIINLCIREGKKDFEVSKIDLNLCIQGRSLSRKGPGGPQSASIFNTPR